MHDIGLGLSGLWSKAVDDSENPASLVGLGDDDLVSNGARTTQGQSYRADPDSVLPPHTGTSACDGRPGSAGALPPTAVE